MINALLAVVTRGVRVVLLTTLANHVFPKLFGAFC